MKLETNLAIMNHLRIKFYFHILIKNVQFHYSFIFLLNIYILIVFNYKYIYIPMLLELAIIFIGILYFSLTSNIFKVLFIVPNFLGIYEAIKTATYFGLIKTF
jgi:hypothetical protein